MKKLFYGFCILSLVAFIGLFASCGTDEEAEATTEKELKSYSIRVSLCNGQDHPQSIGAKMMKDLIEEETEGRVEVALHLNSELGAERESVEQVQNGVIEMASASAGPLTTFDNNMMVLDIPFAFNTYQEAWMVLDSQAGQRLLKSLESAGLKGLAFLENGFRQTTNSVRPIEKPSDFDGIKLRTMEAPMHMENFSLLGANPTPVPWSELYQTLSQQIVDGQENPLANLWELQLWEVQDYVSLTNHIYDPMPLVTNLEWYNQLPEEDQQLISEAALLGQNYSRFLNFEREKILKKALEEKGMEVNELSPEQLEVFREKSQAGVIEKIKEETGEEFVNDWVESIAKARASVVQGVE